MSEHANKAHSDFGGSVIGRVIACAGSVALCKTVPERLSSSYADEGTFAHALGEKHLRAGNFDASQSIGDEVHSDKIASAKIVTDEMAAAVQVYLDAVREEMNLSTDPVLLIEERFELPVASAEPGEVFGANDALVYHPSTGRLVVFDYKHGQGVSVSAEDNAQLKFYAAGAALSHPDWPISELVLVIVQPRARDADEQDIPGVKPWPMDTFELLEFVGTVEDAVKRAKTEEAAMARDPNEWLLTAGEGRGLHAGSWCRWCPAAAVCPAKQKEVVASIGVDFHDIAGISPKALPVPAEMDTKRIGQLLQGLDVLNAWATQVREFAFGLLEQGVPVPGFKLVDKIGRRKWIDNEVEIAGYLEMVYGVEGDDAFPRSLVTINEAERLIKARITDKAGRKAALDDLSLRFTLKDSSGKTMAPDTDRRDAVTAGASADFAGVDLTA
jgi:Protein of unknown function (DUF2800)